MSAAAGGKKHAARMAYALAPPFELVVRFEVKPDEERHYEARGVKLKAGEVVADGSDEVGVVVFVHRSDVEDPDEAVQDLTVEERKVELDGRLEGGFEWKEDEAFSEPGKDRLVVSSKKVLLYREQGEQPLKLKVKQKVKLPGAAADARPLQLEGEVLLTPRPVYLKLWVVPGGVPGTSEAGAFACLAPDPARPLKGLGMTLRVEGGGTASLTADAEDATTGADGLAAWTLRYAGLRWDTLAGASFRVVCGVEGPEGTPSEATELAFDVNRNVSDLLAMIHGDRKRAELDLGAPFLSTEGAGLIRTGLDYLYPDYLTGPAMNIAYAAAWAGGLVSTNAARAEQYLGHYLCGSLASRIGGYATLRKFGRADSDPDQLARMNGVEVNEYYMWYIPKSHHFAGIHLAGTSSDDDPRFLDPWWRQDWSLPEYMTLAGLFDKNSERLRGTTSIAAAAVLTILAAKILVVVFSVGMLTALQMVRTLLASVLGLGLPTLVISTYTDAVYVHNGTFQGHRQRWRTHAVDRLKRLTPVLPTVSPLRGW